MLMRPTGEASKPVSGDFDCHRFFGSSSSVLRRRLTERPGSGVSWRCTLTGRFRESKLVVSASHSKQFFHVNEPCAFQQVSMRAGHGAIHSAIYGAAEALSAREIP